MENAIEADPTLLNRKDVRSLYKEMHKVTYTLRKKHKVKTGKRASPEKLARKKVAEKVRDAEIFEQTSKLVNRLYRLLVEDK